MSDKKKVKADEKVSKKDSKAKEKAAKKSSEYARPLHQDGQFGGDGAQDRARQRRFQVTAEPVIKHPGVGGPVPGLPGLPGAPGSSPDVSEE
jgi:hypothetical protein